MLSTAWTHNRQKKKPEQMEEKASTEMNDDITTSCEGRCFIHLQEDVYVVI
jgi:hypothetical protein